MIPYSGILSAPSEEEIERKLSDQIDVDGIENVCSDNMLSSVYFAGEEEYVVKVITSLDYRYQAMLTRFRNVAFSYQLGLKPFMIPQSPRHIVERQADHLNRMVSAGINSASPLHTASFEDFSILLMDKIHYGKKFDTVFNGDDAKMWVREFFKTVNQIHNNDILHGDIQTNNILLSESEVHLIDPMPMKSSQACELYDIGCALSVACEVLEDKEVIEIAESKFDNNKVTESSKIIPLIIMQQSHKYSSLSIKKKLNKNG